MLEDRTRMVELQVDAAPALPRLLASVPHLQRLHLGVGPALEISDEVRSPCTLSTLKLNAWDFETIGYMAQYLLRCSQHTLRHLYLHAGLASRLSDFLLQLVVLTHLELQLWRRLIDDPFISELLADALSRCTALRSLHLVGSTFPLSDIARIPPQVSSLRFGQAVGEASPRSLLSDNSRGALRRVVLDQSEESRWEALGEELGWQVDRVGEKVVFAR